VSHDKESIEKILHGHGDWFTAQLLRLIMKADSGNLERLRLGFPEEVAAYEHWRTAPFSPKG
jgi:hypothetical protein